MSIRYLVVNLESHHGLGQWAVSTDTYRHALEQAIALESTTGQLHGVQRG